MTAHDVRQKTPADLEAFCVTCPDPQGVTCMLQALGFDLAFTMDAIIYPPYVATPALPAQFHYSDRHGTEVIYLAGRDATTDEIRLPEHASRFWLFPGADQAAYHLTRSTLALTWRLTWQPVDSHVLEEARR